MTASAEGRGLPPDVQGDEHNRRYWEGVGAEYNAGWEHPAMRALSDREMAFVSRALDRTPATTVLDIGIGNGRVIDTLLQNDGVTTVYGIDIAQEMVDVCRRKYVGEPRVRELQVCDLSRQALGFDGEAFDFVSAVRMLKYNLHWDKVLSAISDRLGPSGIFLFTMPNRNSLNRYSRYPIASYTSTETEICQTCRRSGLRVIELASFSKIPTRFYLRSQSLTSRRLLLSAESALERALGPSRFGRELFVVAERAQKPS